MPGKGLYSYRSRRRYSLSRGQDGYAGHRTGHGARPQVTRTRLDGSPPWCGAPEMNPDRAPESPSREQSMMGYRRADHDWRPVRGVLGGALAWAGPTGYLVVGVVALGRRAHARRRGGAMRG